uniref:Uncharacterized protein n=1 Tax=Ralstonia solanacearum TaxID=305 RepID=A0A0S4VYG4_RALSL|nr:protein of unknown function [Ralstonia solanacearum]
MQCGQSPDGIGQGLEVLGALQGQGLQQEQIFQRGRQRVQIAIHGLEVLQVGDLKGDIRQLGDGERLQLDTVAAHPEDALQVVDGSRQSVVDPHLLEVVGQTVFAAVFAKPGVHLGAPGRQSGVVYAFSEHANIVVQRAVRNRASAFGSLRVLWGARCGARRRGADLGACRSARGAARLRVAAQTQVAAKLPS